MTRITRLTMFGFILSLVPILAPGDVRAEEIPDRGPVSFSVYDKDSDGAISEEEFDAVLYRQKYTQKVSRKKIDGDVEAHLVALSCSEPPPGRARWTLRLLADSIVELGYVESISHEAVRQTLKKTNLNRG